MERIVLCFVFAMAVTLSACGGGSSGGGSGDGGDGNNQPELKNVALQKNGGTATASYDSANADIVNDGDDNSQPFWAGNANGDYVTVEFDDIYSLERIRIVTNATSNTLTQLQVSTDGTNFADVGYFSGSPRCANLSMGSGRIDCGIPEGIDASHVRVVITTDNASSVQISEIEAMGN